MKHIANPIVRVLGGVVLLQALSIGWILWSRTSLQSQPVASNSYQPLSLALVYDAADSRFEEMAARRASELDHQERGPDGRKNMTVLGYAALMEETNYVRSLLRHGANAEVAVNDLGQRRSTNAILLIRQVHSELAGGKSVPVREGNRSGNSSGPGN